MKSHVQNPVHWRVDTLLKFGHEELHSLASTAAGTCTSYRLVLGRCLLAMKLSKGYKKFGCSSAAHYATTRLKMSARVANCCIRVARRLCTLPELTMVAELGRIDWCTLREIVRKATPETESLWLKLAEKYDYKRIEYLVSQTPEGGIPGDVFTEDESATSELRCKLSEEVFAMLQRARRVYSLEKDEAVTTAEVIEWALTSYIAGQPADPETLEKVREEADEESQAERARQRPLVAEARELAEEMTRKEAEVAEKHEELLAEAVGATLASIPKRPTRDIEDWQNLRLRFNPLARHTTRAQKKELLRRDGWSCQTPGCPNKVWLHLHHLVPHSKGGPTDPRNIACLCGGCHRNHHQGLLLIQKDDNGHLIFRDAEGRRLDRQADLELAAWLDRNLGWSGAQQDSHTLRALREQWKVFATS